MRSLLIATNGLLGANQPCIAIATEGLLDAPDEPPIYMAGGAFIVPCFERHKWIQPRKDVCVEVEGCSMQVSTAQPEVKFSMSFNVIGCQEEDERETFLFAQLAHELLWDIKADRKDFIIFSLQKDLEELREQTEIGTFKDQVLREKRRKK
jgi:hypothetical protein